MWWWELRWHMFFRDIRWPPLVVRMHGDRGRGRGIECVRRRGIGSMVVVVVYIGSRVVKYTVFGERLGIVCLGLMSVRLVATPVIAVAAYASVCR